MGLRLPNAGNDVEIASNKFSSHRRLVWNNKQTWFGESQGNFRPLCLDVEGN